MTGLIETGQFSRNVQLPRFESDILLAVPENASFADLWAILWHRRRLILTIVFILMVATLFYCSVATPRYKAAAEIEIDPRDRIVIANDVNPTSVAPDGGVTQVETQTRVITSSAVLLRAIAATNLTADPEFNHPRASTLLEWLEGPKPRPRTKTEILDDTLRSLEKAIVVERADRVFVAEVVATSRDPAKAARLANAVADAYLADQFGARAEAIQKASDGLTGRLDEQRALVEQAERAVENYKVSHGLMTIGGRPIEEHRLGESEAELAQARTRTAALRAQLDQIEAARASGTIAATTEALAAPTVSKLRETEATLEQHVSDMEIRFGPDYPGVESAQAQLAKLRSMIGTELHRVESAVRGEYTRALDTERQLEARFAQQSTAVEASEAASVKLRELERELDARKSVYALFLLRAQETREQAGIDSTNARVITRAIPPAAKSWPPRLLLLLGAIGGGLGLGGALALILEHLRPTLLSRTQLERATRAPVVGAIPISALHRNGERQPSELGPLSLVLARLFDRNPGARSFLFVSGPRGRSARAQLCRLTGAVAALRGERALLIRADFSGGTAEGQSGLQEILDGQASLDSVLGSDGHAVMAEIGRGRSRTALPRAGARQNAAKLLADAQSRFDLVIIDGGTATENICLSPVAGAADCVVFVAELGRTRQHEAEAAADAMAAMGAPISAAIALERRKRR